MWDDTEFLVVSLSWVVQILGVCGVAAARLRSAHGSRQKCDWFVLFCFAVVGTISAVLIGECNRCGLAIATTLPLMAVFATLDLKKVPRPAAF